MELSAKSSANLTSKFADLAGKKMRKLRRNWSIKKSDITRSLSKIRTKRAPPIFRATVGGKGATPADYIRKDVGAVGAKRAPSFKGMIVSKLI